MRPGRGPGAAGARPGRGRGAAGARPGRGRGAAGRGGARRGASRRARSVAKTLVSLLWHLVPLGLGAASRAFHLKPRLGPRKVHNSQRCSRRPRRRTPPTFTANPARCRWRIGRLCLEGIHTLLLLPTPPLRPPLVSVLCICSVCDGRGYDFCCSLPAVCGSVVLHGFVCMRASLRLMFARVFWNLSARFPLFWRDRRPED